MMHTVACRGCGCRIMLHAEDDPNRPIRCAACWLATPTAVIVQESKEYDERRKQARKETER